jgi:hypothetical protein
VYCCCFVLSETYCSLSEILSILYNKINDAIRVITHTDNNKLDCTVFLLQNMINQNVNLKISQSYGSVSLCVTNTHVCLLILSRNTEVNIWMILSVCKLIFGTYYYSSKRWSVLF